MQWVGVGINIIYLIYVDADELKGMMSEMCANEHKTQKRKWGLHNGM